MLAGIKLDNFDSTSVTFIKLFAIHSTENA